MAAGPDPSRSSVCAPRPTSLRFGRYKVPVPRTKSLRTTLGVGLIVLGLIPFIPPGTGGVALGFAYLSIDYPQVRRPRRRVVVAGGRWLKTLRENRCKKAAPLRP